MKLRITQLIPGILVISTLIGVYIMYTININATVEHIRSDARDKLQLDISRLQNVLYNLLTEGSISDARLNISVMAMDTSLQTVILTDENDRILIANQYRWENESTSSIPNFDPQIAEKVKHTNTAHVAFRQNDNTLLNGYYPIILRIEDAKEKPVKRLGVLFIEMDIQQSLLAAFVNARNQSVMLGMLMLAVSLLIAYLLHRRISHRLGILARASETLASGDLDTEIIIEGQDELNELGNAFNEMRKRIRHDIRRREQAELELRELNNTLEERIQQGTLQLRNELLNREKLEKQLQQSQKMESLGHLTGGIAHDFNNILASIVGFTELAQLLNQDKRLGSYLGQIISSGERATSLVSQMLMFSRTEGDIEEKENLSVNMLVNDAAKMLKPLLPSSIELSVCHSDHQPVVHANEVMINQIIMNLCINAKDAIQYAQGSIAIIVDITHHTDSICASCHHTFSGDFVEISVTDSGCGIDENVQDKLFDPFFSTKEREKGTGMGLSMVHGLAHKHGGHVLVESNPGDGARFRVLLPASHQPASTNTQDASIKEVNIPGDNKGRHILVIDDEVTITMFLRELLQHHGFRVTEMNDSVMALSYFEAHEESIDLVITDQTMPNMTGMQIVSAMLAIAPHMPIILCTGFSEHVSKEKVLAMNVRAYMTKPLRSTELLMNIENILDFQQPMDSS